MLGLFKKRSKEEQLHREYEKLMKRSHAISTSNRAEADRIYAQAQEITKQIDALMLKQKSGKL